MVRRDRQDPDSTAVGEKEKRTARSAASRIATAARARLAGSAAQSLFARLRDLDFADQAMLFGAGLLVSLLPLIILLGAFASNRVDDDISFELGLGGRASGIVGRLFASAPASLNVSTATSLLFVVLGTLAVAGSLRQIYEKVFLQGHRGGHGFYRLPIWIVAVCLAVACEGAAGRAVGATSSVLVALTTFGIMTPFFWWTMHFLLGGRVPWRTLLPSAIATGAMFAGLGVFSKFYFSSTIASDSTTYGLIGAVFGIMTWFIAIGAVIILGAVAGVVWTERRGRAANGVFADTPPGRRRR